VARKREIKIIVNPGPPELWPPELLAPAQPPRPGARRRNVLDPAIDKAVMLAGGPHDVAAVRLQLKELALNGVFPFTSGFDKDGALLYTNPNNNQIMRLTPAMLGKRLRRRQQRDR
jgi:hypothetical protein